MNTPVIPSLADADLLPPILYGLHAYSAISETVARYAADPTEGNKTKVKNLVIETSHGLNEHDPRHDRSAPDMFGLSLLKWDTQDGAGTVFVTGRKIDDINLADLKLISRAHDGVTVIDTDETVLLQFLSLTDI